MSDDIRAQINALSEKLDAHIAREERLENAVIENGKAIARLEGKIAGSIIIIGLAAGLLGPMIMVIVNLVSR